jgi:lipopolysaccharide biosynthesis regulator YciM
MSFNDLVLRWDNFLAKLKERFWEVLKQSEEPMNDIINSLQYDTVVIHNIRNGLHNQAVTQLMEKAEQGWSKMQGEMSKHGKFFYAQQESEHKKLEAFRSWLDDEFMKYEVGVYGRAARKILENVQRHIEEKKMHRCTQCAGELPIRTYSFMAINIKCDSCGSVNTYQPDDRIRALEYYVINHLAEEQALPHKLRAKYDRSAMKEYYETYYGFLMENVPDKKEFYQRDMHERITNPFFTSFG